MTGKRHEIPRSRAIASKVVDKLHQHLMRSTWWTNYTASGMALFRAHVDEIIASVEATLKKEGVK